MLLRPVRAILFLFLLSTTAVSPVFAVPSDARLIQLVPSDSQIVAGMQSRSRKDELDSFLLITKGNKIDLQDFFAMVGADSSRSIREVVFVSAMGESGILNEHSLLASGHFNRDAIYKLADGGSATRTVYRGVPVLVVPPFEREAGKFDQLRWMAITREGIAIFGTVQSVKRELDRWVGGAPADPTLIARLEQLAGDDESWCLLPAQLSARLAGVPLAELDPKLGAMAKENEPLAYGIHFGRKIEVTVSSGPPERTGLRAENGPGRAKMASDLLSRSDAGSSGERMAVSVSRSRYARWVSGFSIGASLNNERAQ